jgi:drug/metabolite transporter (DMT)-like permease
LSIILLTSIALIVRIFSNPLANVFQKKLTGGGNHPLLVNFLSYLFLSLVCLIISFAISWPALTSEFWVYSILGGVAGAVGNGFLVKALQTGDLSVLGPINAYKSVVGMIVGIILLRELPNAWGAIGTCLIIAGSYFVLDTTEEKFSWSLLKKKEIQYRIWAMILTAVEAVFLKKIILASYVTIAFFSWCWFGAVFSFLFLLLYKIRLRESVKHLSVINIRTYLYLVCCIGAMQFTTNFVFENMPVGYALALFQLSTIVSVILGYRIFKEKDIRKKLIGSLIMMAGSVIIILLK